MRLTHTSKEMEEHQSWEKKIEKMAIKHPYEAAAAKRYFEECRKDLFLCLFVYRGVRLRDIKSTFSELAHNLDLDKLYMNSWCTFLLQQTDYIEYKMDSAKEEVIAFASDFAVTHIGKGSRDLEQMIISTPRNDPNDVRREKLHTVTAVEIYSSGFMDAADGNAILDPRIPNQNVGVAAEAATKSAEMKKKKRYRAHKQQSFEEQTATRPVLPTTTIETTGPLEETQNGSLAAFLQSMQDHPVDDTQQSGIILSPSGFSSLYGPGT